MHVLSLAKWLPGIHLVPALTQAINDDDLGALEFQQWVEREGWPTIQRNTRQAFHVILGSRAFEGFS